MKEDSIVGYSIYTSVVQILEWNCYFLETFVPCYYGYGSDKIFHYYMAFVCRRYNARSDWLIFTE